MRYAYNLGHSTPSTTSKPRHGDRGFDGRLEIVDYASFFAELIHDLSVAWDGRASFIPVSARTETISDLSSSGLRSRRSEIDATLQSSTGSCTPRRRR